MSPDLVCFIGQWSCTSWLYNETINSFALRGSLYLESDSFEFVLLVSFGVIIIFFFVCFTGIAFLYGLWCFLQRVTNWYIILFSPILRVFSQLARILVIFSWLNFYMTIPTNFLSMVSNDGNLTTLKNKWCFSHRRSRLSFCYQRITIFLKFCFQILMFELKF